MAMSRLESGIQIGSFELFHNPLRRSLRGTDISSISENVVSLSTVLVQLSKCYLFEFGSVISLSQGGHYMLPKLSGHF